MAVKIYYDKRLWVVKITMFGENMLGFAALTTSLPTAFILTCAGCHFPAAL